MLAKESLKDILHRSELSNTDKVLICLSVNEESAKAVKEIRQLAIAAGLRKAKNWNVSAMLDRSGGKAVRTSDGWELASLGKSYVAKLVGSKSTAVVTPATAAMRRHLHNMKNKVTRSFVDEAVKCCESGFLRAAVVLSWIGAISLLYTEVLNNHLKAFNTEAKRRNAKWKPAKTGDDLGRMKERDFLDIAESISVIGKNVKKELCNCLDLRNGCGHPNSLRIGAARVNSHLETLILNVYSKYS